MSVTFENRVCVVTGGASGFGLGIAGRLLSYGAEAVWLLDFNQLNLDRALASLSERWPGRIFARRTDIAAQGEIGKAIDEVISGSGRVDVLFNNAGRPMTRPVTGITPEEFRALIDLNYAGVVMGTLKVLPGMIGRGSGLVVNAASAGGLLPFPYQSAYCSTKAAVIAFTRCLAYEFADTDIRFVQYSPVNVATGIFSAERAEKLRRAGVPEEQIAAETEKLKPPADAMPLEEALDILFAGIGEGRTDILIGEAAVQGEKMFVNDRPAFDRIALGIGAKRRAYYHELEARRARGESTDGLVFPG